MRNTPSINQVLQRSLEPKAEILAMGAGSVR